MIPNENNFDVNVGSSDAERSTGQFFTIVGNEDDKNQQCCILSDKAADKNNSQKDNPCVDNRINFVINPYETSDDDTNSVDLRFNSTAKFLFSQHSNTEHSQNDRCTGVVNNEYENLGDFETVKMLNKSQEQHQQLLQKGHASPTENANINLDAFVSSYGSWPTHPQSEGVACGSISDVSFSVEPKFFGGSMSQSQQHSYGISESDALEKETLGTQSKQEMDDSVRSNLFFSGLHFSVTDIDLYNHCKPYGEIESAKVMLDIHTGKSRGIAFVKFADVFSAEKAIAALHNSIFVGERLTVRVAKPHAAYRPAAPTNKTFVRNVPLNIKKADLVKYFERYGEVLDVSIHGDTAQHVFNRKRNVAFITYVTKEAAAKAAQETHTTTPFPECEDVPLLAKVAEDSAHRIERLARRGLLRNLNNPNGNFGGANRCFIPPCFPPAPVDHFVPPPPPSYHFAPNALPNNYNECDVTQGICAQPMFSMPVGHGSVPQFVFVGPESNPALFAPPVFNGAIQAMAQDAKSVGLPMQRLLLCPQSGPAMVAPQPTLVYYVPVGPVPLAVQP